MEKLQQKIQQFKIIIYKMNKLSLSTLSLQQLKAHQQILAKRIDDLKFFNLDLGRENIRLAEQYKVARQHAVKIQQGKASKIRRAKNLTKNIYLPHEAQYSHIQRVEKVKKQDKNSGLKLNDIYKVGKSKLTSWWGGSSTDKSKSKNVNQHSKQEDHYQYTGINNGQGYYQQAIYTHDYQNQVIVVEFPPAEIIKESQQVQSDPMEQMVSQIVKQNLRNSIKEQNLQEGQNNEDKNQDRNYKRLYSQQDGEIYITELQRQSQEQYRQPQQQFQFQKQHQSYKSLDKDQEINYPHAYPQQQQKVYHYDTVNSSQNDKKTDKKPNRKNFEFDDLPGMGWRKIKGLMGFGSKKSKNTQNENISNNNNNQQHHNLQQQHYYNHQQHQHQYHQHIQGNPYNIISHLEQQQVVQQPINGSNSKRRQTQQRKRIPIFGGSHSKDAQNHQYKQKEYDHELKQNTETQTQDQKEKQYKQTYEHEHKVQEQQQHKEIHQLQHNTINQNQNKY